jgi:hypothetical protein
VTDDCSLERRLDGTDVHVPIQVAANAVKVRRAEAERRHQASRLGLLRIRQPLPKVFGRVRNHAGGKGPPRAERVAAGSTR